MTPDEARALAKAAAFLVGGSGLRWKDDPVEGYVLYEKRFRIAVVTAGWALDAATDAVTIREGDTPETLAPRLRAALVEAGWRSPL